MKVKEISLSVRRSRRHESYVMSHVECNLVACPEEGDKLDESVRELHEDVIIVVEEMMEKEKEDYEKGLAKIRGSRQPKMDVPF